VRERKEKTTFSFFPVIASCDSEEEHNRRETWALEYGCKIGDDGLRGREHYSEGVDVLKGENVSKSCSIAPDWARKRGAMAFY
jgi:hypothetical protein